MIAALSAYTQVSSFSSQTFHDSVVLTTPAVGGDPSYV
jgi:hypothetical protein